MGAGPASAGRASPGGGAGSAPVGVAAAPTRVLARLTASPPAWPGSEGGGVPIGAPAAGGPAGGLT
eukprot:9864005-Alexandrium_andersonii.AAC.1